MQPHELFSIIVAFSRDYDKATDQVLANEKRKQRERKQSGNGSSRQGKPPMHSSPAPAVERPLKASNHQPSMGSILKELKARPQATVAESTSGKPHHHRQQSRGDTQPESPTAPGYQPYFTPDRQRARPPVPPSSSSGDDRPGPHREADDDVVLSKHPPSVDSNPPESAPTNLVPITPRSMAAVRAKARLRRQRAAPPPTTTREETSHVTSHHLPDDASTDAPLSPRATIRSRRRMDLQQANKSRAHQTNHHFEQALELD